MTVSVPASKPDQDVLPTSDESLLGFLRRYSDEDYYPDLPTFMNALSIRYDRPLLEDLQGLARQLSVGTSHLERIAPIASSSAGVRDRSYDRLQVDPVCPCCLAEGRNRQQAWRHALVTACPDHGVRLHDICNSCEEPLGLETGGQFHCACGIDLRLAETTKASAFEIVVAAAIEGSSTDTSYVPADWRQAPPPDIARFFSTVAGFDLKLRTGKAGKTPKPRSVEEAVRFHDLVEPLMRNWPTGFQKAVAERISRSEDAQQTAVQILGNWYQALMRLDPDCYAPVREAIRAAISQSYPGRTVPTSQVPKTDHWITAAQAARDLNMRAETIVDAVRSGEIEGEIRSSGLGHRHTVIRTSSISAIRAVRSRYITAATLRERLGVSKKHLDLLKETGFVTEVPKADRPLVSQGPFDWTAISDCIEEIFSRATPVDPDEEALPLRNVNLRKTTDKSALLAFYKKIWDGSVVPVPMIAEAKLGDLRFRVSDVERSLVDRPDMRSWTAQEVAGFAGWKPECVTHWCKLGLLKSVVRTHAGHSKFLITPRDLSTFQTRYVPLAQLADQRETASRKLLSRLPIDAVVGAKPVGKTRRCILVDLAKLPIENNSALAPEEKQTP